MLPAFLNAAQRFKIKGLTEEIRQHQSSQSTRQAVKDTLVFKEENEEVIKDNIIGALVSNDTITKLETTDDLTEVNILESQEDNNESKDETKEDININDCYLQNENERFSDSDDEEEDNVDDTSDTEGIEEGIEIEEIENDNSNDQDSESSVDDTSDTESISELNEEHSICDENDITGGKEEIVIDEELSDEADLEFSF